MGIHEMKLQGTLLFFCCIRVFGIGHCKFLFLREQTMQLSFWYVAAHGLGLLLSNGAASR